MAGNLVLIDADMRVPVIYTIDKQTGKMLSGQPFEPILQECANSEMLATMFSHRAGILGQQLIPFDKTKVRFIHANQNSLFVSDLGRSIVYKTNMNGEIQLAFGHFGRKQGEFNEPSGLHVESDGSAILVGDSKNDRLQVYNSSSYFKKKRELFN
jgi:hypothetical protein